MAWGTVELESEVVEWLDGLPDEEFGHVAFYIDLLADRGVGLGAPHTRQLRRKLRELRFYDLRGERRRISYYIAPGRRIILLTVFKKHRQREAREIARVERAMNRCIRERHTAGGKDDG